MHCTKQAVDITISNDHVAKKLHKSVIISIFTPVNQTNTSSNKS